MISDWNLEGFKYKYYMNKVILREKLKGFGRDFFNYYQIRKENIVEIKLHTRFVIRVIRVLITLSGFIDGRTDI